MQEVVHGLAALASPGAWVEVQNLSSPPTPAEPEPMLSARLPGDSSIEEPK